MLERAFLPVSRDEDALPCAFLPVLFLQQLTENAERHGRLGRGAGLRDNVDAHVTSLAQADQLGQGGGADAVPGEVDIGGILAEIVIQRGFDELDNRPRTEVGAADADGNENLAGLPDAFRRLDAGEFRAVIILRQCRPAEEIATRAAMRNEQLMGGVHHGL